MDKKVFDRDRFKKSPPKIVALPDGEVVERGFFGAAASMPLVFTPTAEEIDLPAWARAHRSELDLDLARYGALLFRGFGIAAQPADFERFAAAVCDQLFDENGEHPRETVDGRVYTPTFYPADQKLLWHNENSFNHEWPTKILFGCARAPAVGGETPIVDSRKVYERVAPAIRRRWLERGVTYMRNYHPGLGLSWREVFRIRDERAVEPYCREQRLEFDWVDDRLRTRARRPTAVRHPRTGEMTWFNQAQHWHVSCLDPATQESIRSLYPDADLPRHCFHGDDTPIPDDEMRHLLEVYAELEVSFPWLPGDVLLVDNLLVAHARNAYAGDRKLLVSLGDMSDYDHVSGSR